MQMVIAAEYLLSYKSICKPKMRAGHTICRGCGLAQQNLSLVVNNGGHNASGARYLLRRLAGAAESPLRAGTAESQLSCKSAWKPKMRAG
eukprot:11769572-Karenia_brevis.AAC.1